MTASPAGRSFGPAASTSHPARRIAGRMSPASREDRVLRLMLTDPQSWDAPSGEEHVLLCELPVPHGPLFVWPESQLHEHGPQPWAALRSGGFGSTHEAHPVGPEAIEVLAPN